MDQGLAPNKLSVSRLTTFGDLIDLHIIDMCEVGKPPRRSKAATLPTLKRDLAKEKIGHLDRQKLIDYGKMRADQGAGPVTLGIDIGVIKMIITHAAAVHGLDISPEEIPRYACVRGRLDYGEPSCIAFGGLRVDDAVEAALLAVVRPAAIQAAEAAEAQASMRRDEARDALARELRRRPRLQTVRRGRSAEPPRRR